MKIKTRRYYIYYLAKILFFVISLVPLRVSLLIAGAIGNAAFLAAEKYRKRAIDNLIDALGVTRLEAEIIARKVFSNVAKNGAEWIKLFRLDPSDLGTMLKSAEGIEYLEEAFKEGKGVIVIAAHFGNWELMPIYIRSKVYDGAVIARRIYFHKYDEFIAGLRTRFGVRMIYRDESPKKILKELKKGNILGILADQDVDSVDGVFVKFFSKEAYTPTAPVKLAMATGAKLVPAFVVRDEDDRHILVVEKPIEIVLSDDKEGDIVRYTQVWTDVLEKYVRKYPHQWVWFHSRWKTKKN